MSRNRFTSSLRFKVTVGVIVILVIVMSGVFVLQYRSFRREMIERLGLSAIPLSDVIKGSLKHAMATRDLEEIRHIVRNVSRQEGVVRVFVTDKQGVIRISAEEKEIGRRLEPGDPTCQICHRQQAETRQKTVIFAQPGGGRVFRNVNPIRNEPECEGCHGRRDRILGVLISDFSMAQVDRRLSSKFREMLASLLSAVAVTVITISFIMNRLVIGRLERFARATRLLGSGHPEERVRPEGADEIGALAVSFNEMAERLRRAREIRERKELLENVLNNVQESIIVFDPQGAILTFSRGSEETFGFGAAEMLGRPYSILGGEREEIQALVRDGAPYAGEVRLRNKDGRYFPALVSVFPLRSDANEVLAFVEIARDLTEERVKERLRQQLLQSEKLAAIGQLAAGVAHELNNPLGNILLYAELLAEDLAPQDVAGGNARHIVENTLRCRQIVRGLLDYAKQSEVHIALHDVNEVAESSVRMLRNEMRLHDIECELRLPADLPKVGCDRNRIQQVLVNLIQNAIQAVEQHGRIEVFTERAPDGQGVLLGVRDDGGGIAPEVLPRIFEPFYTTKEQGTGLGLSICYGIVERHQGRIWAEGRPASGNDDGRPGGGPEARGTTFYVQLPAG